MSTYAELKKIYAEAAVTWPDNHLYCLADHAGMPGLLRELDASGIAWTSLFDGSRERNALEVAPLLFPLDEESNKEYSHLLRWVEEHGTYTSSMLLISSSLNKAELSRRLAQRLDARVSEQMNVMLRYFDPRIFEALLTVLNESQRGVFLSVADCWWYFDRSGTEMRQTAKYELVDRFEAPLVLTAEQEFALLDASEADQVAAQLREMMPDQYLQIPLPQQHAFIMRHMAAARAVGVVATHELSLYCGLALLYGEDFALTPHWQQLLQRVGSGQVSLSDAVANEDGEFEYAA